MNPLIVSSVVGWVADFFKNKKELNMEIQKAKIANVNSHLAGWSDEYLILVWGYPFITMFIPALSPATIKGFEQIALLPDWYIGGFISITFSVFGINKLFAYKAK
jgi:hypothetical protein